MAALLLVDPLTHVIELFYTRFLPSCWAQVDWQYLILGGIYSFDRIPRDSGEKPQWLTSDMVARYQAALAWSQRTPVVGVLQLHALSELGLKWVLGGKMYNSTQTREGVFGRQDMGEAADSRPVERALR